VIVLDHRHEPGDMKRALCDHHPELSQMAADHIDDLGPLTDQKITSAEHNGGSLLLLALHRHETHSRPLCGFADCFRIGRIILLPFDERLQVVWRDEPDHVPQLRDLAPPVMALAQVSMATVQAGCAARKPEHPIAAKFLAEDHSS
jgi:hypothetical protein